MTDERPTETKGDMRRVRKEPEGVCCWCREPEEEHPIEEGSNSHTGNYAAHEYVDSWTGHGVDIHDYIEVTCPWCGSGEEAHVTAYARGDPEIYCNECDTRFRSV